VQVVVVVVAVVVVVLVEVVVELVKKDKAILVKTWTGPEGSRKLRLPHFMTIGRHMKVVRSSAQRTCRLYRSENIPSVYFCERPGRSQGHSAAGMIMSIKNTIGNRTRDLPSCSAVP
jgi:hypothetical protein